MRLWLFLFINSYLPVIKPDIATASDGSIYGFYEIYFVSGARKGVRGSKHVEN